MKNPPVKKNLLTMLLVIAMAAFTSATALAARTPAQQAYLKASNTGTADSFGFGSALSGDTLVVGAPFEDSNATGINGNQSNNSATDSGAAYIFVRNGTNWAQQAYLKASNGGAGDYFGIAAAVSGDTLVVGAPRESSNAIGVNGDQSNNSAGSSGAAYVFVREGTNWSQQAYLKASNTEGGDYFGNSVAISADTIVVGAASEDSNAPGVNGDQSNNNTFNAGAAYIFVRSGTNWSQQAYLKASNPGLNDEFGSCVSISGDTVVIGAEGEASNATGVNGNQSDNGASYAGAAYVFVRGGTIWSQQAYLKASNTRASDEFGLTLAVSGDTVVVGAHHEDSDGIGINGHQNNAAAEDSGAAYIFVRSRTNWTQQAYLKASNTQAYDEFGARVAVSGDTVVVAAVSESSNATGVNGNQNDNSAAASGAAYVFTGLGPSAPELNLQHFAGNVRLFWPLSAANFVLDEANDLNAAPTNNWTQVPFPYQTNATDVSVTLPLSSGNKFYRLRQP
jgi:hypothetical protein